MKKLQTLLFFTLLFLSFAIVQKTEIKAEDPTVVYFKETFCLGCAEIIGYPNGYPAGWPDDYDPMEGYVEENDLILALQNQGINVITIDIKSDELATELPYNITYEDFDKLTNGDMFASFILAYGVPSGDQFTPLLFAGTHYFHDFNSIKDATESGDMLDYASDDLKAVTVVEGALVNNLEGFVGFLTVLFAGFLDGFNPCAIALLLLFVSLLGFSENKRILILVSVTYISALFVSYFLLGTLLYSILNTISAELLIVRTVLYWFVVVLCGGLFLFNLYDFIQTKREEYGKVRNQLPKWIQRYNKKLVKSFTNVMNNTDNKKGLFTVLVLTFVLGLLLSLTELICTGQIYLGIILAIHDREMIVAYMWLLAYNIMFIIPLVTIAIISIKGRGVMATSNWIREHMHIIKFFNAMLFLAIAIYFLTRLI